MPKQQKDARTAKGRSRRSFLKGSAALGAAAIAAPAILKTSPRQARAEDNVIRIIGPNVIALDDWTAFTEETGLTVEWKGIASDPGVFLKEAIADEAGEDFDMFCFDGGVEDRLAPEGPGRHPQGREKVGVAAPPPQPAQPGKVAGQPVIR